MLSLPLTTMKTTATLSDERAAVGHTTALLAALIDLHWAFSCFMSSSRVAVSHISTTVECRCDAAPVTKLALPQDEMSKQILHCLTPCGDKHKKDAIEMKILSEL